MRLLTAAEQRELDRLALSEAQLPTRALMESAGAAVARAVLEPGHASDGGTFARAGQPRSPARVLIFCGPGNNGGDGYVAARFLREALLAPPEVDAAAAAPFEPAAPSSERVLCVSSVARAQLRGDALSAAQAWDASGGRTVLVGELEGDPALGALRWSGLGDTVVDAVFGSGLSRPPAGAEGRAIALVNEARARGARVIAVDIPSGIDSDSGAVYPAHVARADVTVTFHLPKRGLWLYPGAASAGRIVVAPIGIPRALEAKLAGAACELLDEAWARATLTPRPMTAHKHDFGHVLALAGSPGKSGAAALLCEAALRSGAGLVTLAARPEVLDRVLPQIPEAMGFPLPAPTGEPSAPLSLADLPALRAALKGKSALAAGPGIARGPQTGPLLGELLAGLDPGCAAVYDADALNALAEHRERIAEWCGKAAVRPVFTPHAAEFSRLTGEEIERIEAERVEATVRAARRFSCVMVLKGARTVIAEPEGSSAICAAGNPGMATAGSGDVLTGVAAALLGRRSGHGSSVERARLAVLFPALAGDEAAAERGQGALLASDLSRLGLPRVFRRLQR
jgi:ADP-dependent NAD(P)H-hydrate dehydratase / NAD(P)H-hydrate epimerase